MACPALAKNLLQVPHKAVGFGRKGLGIGALGVGATQMPRVVTCEEAPPSGQEMTCTAPFDVLIPETPFAFVLLFRSLTGPRPPVWHGNTQLPAFPRT